MGETLLGWQHCWELRIVAGLVEGWCSQSLLVEQIRMMLVPEIVMEGIKRQYHSVAITSEK